MGPDWFENCSVWAKRVPDRVFTFTPGLVYVATLPNGSLCGIRSPMHEQEKPVVRTYLRVADLEAAVQEAGQGTIAIYMFGGIEQGLWQVP